MSGSLPDGFTLDAPPAGALPPGFTLDAAPSKPSKPSMPTPIGVDENGAPIFDDRTDNAANKDVREGEMRMAEKAGEGATFGTLPYGIAAARTLGGTPFQQGLADARAYTAQTSKDQPAASMIAEGAGGLIPTTLGFSAAAPLIAGAGRLVTGGAPMARALLGGAIGGANAAGHDVGSGDTANLGPDTGRGMALGAGMSGAGEVLAPVLQSVPNMMRGLYQGVRNITTDAGREGVAGQILREASGDFPNQNARTAIPGLTLNTPQATGNPGLAGLQRTMASEPKMQTGDLGDFVENGRTPNQTSALATALVGSDARIEPQALVNQASTRGVQAIRTLDDTLHGDERALWQAPALRGVQLDGPGLASGVAQDVAQFPASWRDAVTGPQGTLGAYLRELHELGPNASIPDVNSVRSRLLGAARDAASGPQPDSVTAAAANRMAGSILDRMGQDPAITGTPAIVRPPVTEMHATPDGGVEPVQIAGQTTPATPPNPQAMAAYQAARDYTRQFNGAKGYNEFNNILHPNGQGNMQGNPERQFGQFFDTTGGTSAGLQRLQGLADFARANGRGPEADELQGAANQYLNASVLRAARAGSGLDATGQPNLNLATMASTTNRMAPAVNAVPMTRGAAPNLQAVGNAAELLNRPSTMRGDMNSTTYEKLRNHDLVSAILGQSGSSALGGMAGGVAGYEGGERTGVSPWLAVPAGMAAGVALGNRAGPMIGNVVAHTPIIRGAVTGPSNAIQRNVWNALNDPSVYQRMIGTPMLSGPTMGQPGATSAAVRGLARALLAGSASGETK